MPMFARPARSRSWVGALAGLLLAPPVAASDTDAIAQGARADAAAGIPAPGFLETRATTRSCTTT